MEYDVLVIGAGPAGSSAARACALNGLKTLVIDRKKKSGTQSAGAESISDYLLPYLPFGIPQEELIWRTNGIEFHTKDITIKRTGNRWSGCALDRRKFDKYLSVQAVSAGAELRTDTELVDFEFEGRNQVDQAILKSRNKRFKVRTHVVIGADGCDSTTLKLLDQYKPRKDAFEDICSYEMKKMDLASPAYKQIYVGDFISTGYGYVNPTGPHTANVGVVSTSPKKPLQRYFNEFLEIPQIKDQVRDAVKHEDKGGRISALKLSDKWVYGNTILVGDAADQNLKPFVEGILPSIICGDLAGRTASNHINANKPLEDYKKTIHQKLGPIFAQSDKIGETVYDLYELKEPKEYLLLLLLMADLTTLSKVKKLKEKDYRTLSNMLLTWNNWHKQTRAKTAETIYYEYLHLKKAINAL